MNDTRQIYDDKHNSLPELDLDLIRKDLEQLAIDTVDKTLDQARAAAGDPVLGNSSSLATFYMMLPRNDGRVQEQVLDIIARYIDGLSVINSGLKFGINPKYVDLIKSNDAASIASLQTDYETEPRGTTYRPDALIINKRKGNACLVDFKRQVGTIDATKLNRIADNLTIARAQVADFLYQKHRRMRIDGNAVSWAIIDCSDQRDVPNRFQEAGVFGLDSLDVICGVRNIASAYRLARELMAREFSRGERELMSEANRYVAIGDVEQMIDTAVKEAKRSFSVTGVPVTNDDVVSGKIGSGSPRQKKQNEYQKLGALPSPQKSDLCVRRFGMFGT